MVLTHTAQRSGKLLSFLRRELQLSSSLVKRLKWQDAFWVNGKPEHVDCLIVPGDEITAILDEPMPEFEPEYDPLDILYEDEALLAVDKPAGLLMHPSFYRNSGTLANRILGYYRLTDQACAVHPVSRLDRDTFGVVLFAKNAYIHEKMVQALKARTVEKTYHALVFGTPPEEGTWNFPIARKPGESLLREVREDGQDALTRYFLLQEKNGASKLQLQPVTGRTHQLRVHCSHAGFPILGDRQYGTAESLACAEFPFQQLCAVRLTFPHPVTGQAMTLQSRMDVSL